MNDVFSTLGYRFDSGCFPLEPKKQDRGYVLLRYRKEMAQYVWDASQLEGNPITFPEVQTLMDNITIGGHKISDEDEVIGISDANKYLSKLVETGKFRLDKETSDTLHYKLAHRSVLDAGMFRGQGSVGGNVSVALGEFGYYSPPEETKSPGTRLITKHSNIIHAIQEYTDSSWKQSLMYNMAGCFQQFYFDGNKRTSRLMMNGVLMTGGYLPISIPAKLRTEYNIVMVNAYNSGDASEAIKFIGGCYRE